MAATFILNTRSEFLKTKKTAAFWVCILGAAFIPLVNFIRLTAKADFFAERMQKDPWAIIIRDNWITSAIFLIPMFVILVTSLVSQIEFRNNTWKQVYASPRSYTDIFFSRFLVVHTLVLFCFLMFNLFIVLSSLGVNLLKPQYHFTDHAIPWSSLFNNMFKVYFSVATITVVQYWLSLRFKNFIAPMGIGLALLITGLSIHQWDKLYYYPYMYPAIAYMVDFRANPGFVEKAQLYNIFWFTGILILSFWDIWRRKERG